MRIWNKKGFTRRIPIVWDFALTGYLFEAYVTVSGTGTVVTIPVDVRPSTKNTDLMIDETVDTAVPVGSHTWVFAWTDPEGFRRPVFVGTFLQESL